MQNYTTQLSPDSTQDPTQENPLLIPLLQFGIGTIATTTLGALGFLSYRMYKKIRLLEDKIQRINIKTSLALIGLTRNITQQEDIQAAMNDMAHPPTYDSQPHPPSYASAALEGADITDAEETVDIPEARAHAERLDNDLFAQSDDGQHCAELASYVDDALDNEARDRLVNEQVRRTDAIFERQGLLPSTETSQSDSIPLVSVCIGRV